MKKLISSLVIMGVGVLGAQGTVLLTETFDTLGELNSYAGWTTQTPGVTNDPIIVTANGAAIVHDPDFTFDDAENVQNRTIGTQGAGATTYAGFDMTINTPATIVTGGPQSRFFHFEVAVSDVAVARTFMEAPGAGGDYSLRIGNASAASTQSSDLIFGNTYRVVVAYDGVSGLSTLWIDPLNMGSTSFVGTSSVTGSDVTGVELQQRGQQTGTVLIDNLYVATTFNEALVPEPGTFALILLGSVAVFARRRQFKNVTNS